MRLLLISNSTNAGEAYLAYPMPRIGEFLRGVREVAFVPYAAVTFSYADYERRVQARFSELGIRVRSVHRAADPAAMIRRAEAICVGGGDPQPGEGGCPLRGLVGRQQRGLPRDLDDQRHADRRAGVVSCGGCGEVPDQSPLPRRQSRGTCRRDARGAPVGIRRSQSPPLRRGVCCATRTAGWSCWAAVRCGFSRRD